MTLPHVQWFGLGLTPHTTIYKVYNDRVDNDSLYLATSHITVSSELYVRFYSVVFGGLFTFSFSLVFVSSYHFSFY